MAFAFGSAARGEVGPGISTCVAVAAVSYWGAGSLSTLGVRYLASSRHFSFDDLIKVRQALDKQRIAYRVDEQRRVEVTSDQFEQAAEVISKLDLGQHSIDEIRNESATSSFWDGPGEREQKEKLKLEKILERLIGDQEGVRWPLVSINRPHSSSAFSRNNPKPTAFVYVETEGDRPLPYRTIQAIPAILAANIRDLAPESITVMDRRGHRYLDPGNPSLGDNSRNRAREEEIAEEIVEKLDWIKGVRVQVKLITPRAADATSRTTDIGPIAKTDGPSTHSLAIRSFRPEATRAPREPLAAYDTRQSAFCSRRRSRARAGPLAAQALRAQASSAKGQSRHTRARRLTSVVTSHPRAAQLLSQYANPQRRPRSFA